MGTPRKVTVDLYTNANPPVLIDADIPVKSGYYTDDDSEAGPAEVVVPEIGFPSVTSATEGTLLRFNVEGTPDRTAVVERVRVVVRDVNPANRLRTLTGRDWVAEFEDAVVDPPLGILNLPSAGTVRFDWTHPELDRSAWITPTFIGSVYKGDVDPLGGAVSPAFAGKVGQAPRGWPDVFTGWIWSAQQSGPPNYSHPLGTSYFYLQVDFVTAGFVKGTNCKANEPFVAVFTADDYGQLAFDGAILDAGAEPPAIQWQRTTASGLPEVSPGTHHICIKAENTLYDQYAGTYNVGSVAFSAFQSLTSSTFDWANNCVIRTGNLVNGTNLTTGGRWKCLNNPATAPGFTVGKAFRILFDKAQAAGALPGWTLGFTDANDSRGNPWPVVDTLTATANSTLLSTMKQWHDEGYWDVAARSSTRVLDAWRWQERGDYYTTPGSPLVWDDDNLSNLSIEGKR